MIHNMIRFYGEELLAPRQPQAGEPPLVGCPRLLFLYIRSYPPYRRPFLHPQPEDAPCRGNRDPPITYNNNNNNNNNSGITILQATFRATAAGSCG